MIIIEGMDNTGKTKLSEYLAERFNLPLLKSPKDRANLTRKALDMLVLNPAAVLDRFSVISEIIYGPILRHRSEFDDYVGQWKIYMDKLVRCNPLILYCRPPKEKIFDYGDREQMDGVKEHGEELLRVYDILMSAWSDRLWIVKYDFMVEAARTSAGCSVETYLVRRKVERYEYQ